MSSEIENYIGKTYEFDDGRSIKIIDVRLRDEGEVQYFVNYEITYDRSAVPKRLLMTEREFIANFNHLFFNNKMP